MALRAVARTLAPRLAPARRGLAAEAAAEPPVKLFGIHARYASAAYVSAAKGGKTAQVEGELNALAATLAKDAALSGFVKNPTIPRAEKVAAVEKLLRVQQGLVHHREHAHDARGERRLGEVDKVIEAYATLMKAERKEVDAVITSATELTAAQTKKISAALKPHLKQGETVKLSAKVDPSLLGGLTVQIGDNTSTVRRDEDRRHLARALRMAEAKALYREEFPGISTSDGARWPQPDPRGTHRLASTRPRDSESRVASMAWGGRGASARFLHAGTLSRATMCNRTVYKVPRYRYHNPRSNRKWYKIDQFQRVQLS